MNRSGLGVKSGVSRVVARAALACALCAGIALLGLSGPSPGQTLCVPPAGQFPALPGSPNWWDNTNPVNDPIWIGPWASYNGQQQGDPRWAGSYSQTFPLPPSNGSAEDMVFHAVFDGKPTPQRLFLSWYVESAPYINTPAGNEVYLGFFPGVPASGGSPALDVYIHISKDDGSSTAFPPGSASPPPPPDKQLYTPNVNQVWTSPTGTNTWTPAAIPAWLDHNQKGVQRVWQNPVAPDPNYPNVQTGQWMLNMVIPIASTGLKDGLNLTAAGMKMWFEVDIAHPGPPAAGSTQPTVQSLAYGWPPGVGAYDPNALQPPVVTSWGAAGINCSSAGISIGVSDIGTKNTPSSSILYQYPPDPTKTPPTNTFFANPTNGMGTAIPVGGMSATFRTANWGSTTLWQVVPAGANPGENGGLNVKNLVALPANGTAPVPNAITFNWTLTPAQAADINSLAVAGHAHQCMLVELAGTGMVPLTFKNSSVARNMDFVTASKFERQCEISVKGLAPLAGSSHRKVYLYVDTRNMPAVVTSPPQPGTGKTPPTGREPPRQPTVKAPPPGEPVPPITPKDLKLEGELNPRAFPVPWQNLAGFSPPNWKEPEGRGNGIPPDPLADVPTYVVHAYHETGKSITVNGKSIPTLEPQSSFGYFVQHDGALYGWKHELRGAKEIAPNYYELEVPNDSSVNVTTVIEALESPQRGPGLGGIPWWVWLIVFLVALLLIVLVFRAMFRRRPATP
jgi:hypothetical protein